VTAGGGAGSRCPAPLDTCVSTEALRTAFPGRPRATALSGIALSNSAGHMGEAAVIRAAGGFGTGV
jgi:hypothetical protein